MQPTPYLTIAGGKCAEAIAFYAEVFGGEVTVSMPASEMPAEFNVPEGQKHLLMHSETMLGDGKLMASDDIFGMSGAMAGCSVMMELKTTDAAQAAFDKLAAGGEVGMPFAPTFWSAGFGSLTDRFGTKWMIGSEETP